MSEASAIQRTTDELAIRNALADLAWRADSKDMDDVDAYIDHFTEDAVWEMPGDVRRGRDDIRAGVVGRREGAAQGVATMHFLASTTVSFEDDDNARVRSYVQAYRVVTGDPPLLVLLARYDDRFRRTPKGWKLGRRRIEFA
jgi:ketosteroid isomerase-like protein